MIWVDPCYKNCFLLAIELDYLFAELGKGVPYNCFIAALQRMQAIERRQTKNCLQANYLSLYYEIPSLILRNT